MYFIYQRSWQLYFRSFMSLEMHLFILCKRGSGQGKLPEQEEGVAFFFFPLLGKEEGGVGGQYGNGIK